MGLVNLLSPKAVAKVLEILKFVSMHLEGQLAVGLPELSLSGFMPHPKDLIRSGPFGVKALAFLAQVLSDESCFTMVHHCPG